MRPLEGKRIVVTRSRQQSAEMCRLLKAAGAIPLPFPVIEFTPLPTKPLLNTLTDHRYDWLVFTSVNAVHYYVAAKPPSHAPANIAAVGAATLNALHASGFTIDYVPDTFSGVALAQGLGNVAAQRILLPRASGGRPEITTLLRQNGAIVDDIALYKTVQARVSAEQIQTIQTANAITFTSPSSVRNFLSLVVDGVPVGATVACIGPTTADQAQLLGLTVDIVPQTYTIPDLIGALKSFFSDKNGRQGQGDSLSLSKEYSDDISNYPS